MDWTKFLRKRTKKFRSDISSVEMQPFSEPLTVLVNQIKSIDRKGNAVPLVILEVVSKEITCLWDAVELNRLVVRSLARKLAPQIGDIVCVIDDDPTDVYKQVLVGLIKRGKI